MAEIPGHNFGWDREAPLQFQSLAQFIEVPIHEGSVVEQHVGRSVARGAPQDAIHQLSRLGCAAFIDQSCGIFYERIKGLRVVPWCLRFVALGFCHWNPVIDEGEDVVDPFPLSAPSR